MIANPGIVAIAIGAGMVLIEHLHKSENSGYNK